MIYTQELMRLGLAKNEAQIYEVLIEHGELSVAEISKKAKIHRRNVYDCLNRLTEKGFVSEVVASKENHYKAVNPQKLREVIEEKTVMLNKIMPDLEALWGSTPHNEEIFILKGVEGFKNYMREILKEGEDLYTIGAGGIWADPRLRTFLAGFLKEAKNKGIKMHQLYEGVVKKENREILELMDTHNRFLDEKYSAPAGVDIFGDYVVILTKGPKATIDDSSFTVIKNGKIADAFRIWFQLMWDASAV